MAENRHLAMPSVRPIGSIPVGNILGEGVLWDDREQAFLWTDIEGRKIFSLEWPSRTLETFETPFRVGSFALTRTPGTVIAAFEQGFARYGYRSGELAWLARPELPEGVRFNDGRVDRNGRFVAGTMVEHTERAGRSDAGKLYRLEVDDSLTVLIEGLRITNSLCWSPDGRTMYHCDTLRWAIDAHDYGARATGARAVIETERGHGPDGATVDAAGRIWVALWGASRVAVFAPDGRLLGEVPVSATQPSCPALGGPDLNILAVTSATQGLSPEALADDLGAGDLHLFEVDANGLTECRVR